MTRSEFHRELLNFLYTNIKGFHLEVEIFPNAGGDGIDGTNFNIGTDTNSFEEETLYELSLLHEEMNLQKRINQQKRSDYGSQRT